VQNQFFHADVLMKDALKKYLHVQVHHDVCLQLHVHMHVHMNVNFLYNDNLHGNVHLHVHVHFHLQLEVDVNFSFHVDVQKNIHKLGIPCDIYFSFSSQCKFGFLIFD
jgi:hypothetical protein